MIKNLDKFVCEFPGCNYETDCRNKIHLHHIKPREINGTNSMNNRIYLCPNCHSKIYIPESKSGIHSIATESSIIILNRLSSTNGKVINYKKVKDQKDYLYFYNLKEELLL